MGQVQTSAFLQNLAKGIDAQFLDVFDQNVDYYQSELDMIFNVRSSDKKREHTRSKAGTGLLEEKQEGNTYPQGSQIIGYETEYFHNTFGKQVTVTEEEMEDKDYADKLDEFTDLVRSGSLTMDRAKAQVLNGGFVTTARVNGQKISRLNDGVPLFSTQHPLYGSSTTVSNASSTGVALTDTSLETARNAIKEQLADDETPLAVMGKMMLVVPPALRKTALRITGSELVAGTANNDINVYRGEVDVLECNWLSATNGGSDTAWYVIVPDQAKLMFLERKALSLNLDVDGQTGNRNYQVRARWSVGYSDWRYTWASKGDGQAYSS